MKERVLIVLTALLILSVPAFSEVYTRLEQVSNQNGVLIVDVEAMSDAGPALINLYRGAFRISETLEQRVTNVSFKHLHFMSPAYFQEATYHVPTRLVAWAYKYNPSAGIPHTAIGVNWTTILRVTITYNQIDQKATLSWVDGPTYMVRNELGVDISGSYLPVPADLQDIPLPVQLAAFAAKPLENGAVQITWRTESELNNLGFNLHRSDRENAGFVRINEALIEGQGTTSTAYEYAYLDADAPAAVLWYLIETISTDGLSTFEGPAKTSATGETTLETTPDAFVIISNYPNPFNPSTEIRYTLAASAFVELAIYNISGKLVKQISVGHQTSGAHSIIWDSVDAQGQRVDSGVYICELKAGDQVFYHKMTLLK